MKRQENLAMRRAGTAEVYQDPESMTKERREFAEPGGEWVLRDLHGRTFSSLNLRGSYYLLFFGHTGCPEATPLTVMKMTKAARKLRQHKESQYVTCTSVFVTVQPESDTPKEMRKFGEMFESRGSKNLHLLREKSNTADNLVNMMRKYHVPIGLTEAEQERVRSYFESKEKKAWYKFW